MSGRGKGGKGLGRSKPETGAKFTNIGETNDTVFYVVKKVMTSSGKPTYRAYKATYVSKGKGKGYKITVGGKRVPVKNNKNAFDDMYDARAYAAAKRGCKYGLDKKSGACLTKSGRSAKDYVKKAGRKDMTKEQIREAAMELNSGKSYTNSRSSKKYLVGARKRIGYEEKATKPKRKASAHSKKLGAAGKKTWNELKDGKIPGMKYTGGGIAGYVGKEPYKARLRANLKM